MVDNHNDITMTHDSATSMPSAHAMANEQNIISISEAIKEDASSEISINKSSQANEQNIISINEAIKEDASSEISINKSSQVYGLGECSSLVVHEDASIFEQTINSIDSPPIEPMVDCLGRSITTNRQLGGPRPSFFILGAIVCGYFTFGGVFFNLVIYLRRVWDEGSANAANNSTNLVGTVYCTCILGAFLGDTYLGRMRAVAIFLTIYALGCALSAVGVTLKEINGATSKTFLMITLYIMAVGCGSYQPVIVSLGGDQFDIATQKARFFSWVFVASNLGVMLALTLLTYLENMGRWALGFWISTASVGFSIPLFLIGVPYMRQIKLAANPLVSMARVLVSATRNCHIKINDDRHNFKKNQEKTMLFGNPQISHTHSLRWLDKAAIMNEKVMDSNGLPNPWRLCTQAQVEEVKCVIRIIPLILIGIVYNVANAQLVSLFVVQGDTMDNLLWGLKIPPGSMRLFTNLAGIIFPPFYEYVLVPKIRARTHHEKGFTSLQRMGWGLVFGAKAMVIAAIVEQKRLHNLFKLSILWLIPQFTIMGISNSLFIVSQIDFFYSEIPRSMQSLGSSLFLLCLGLGNYGSSLLVTIVNFFSSLDHAIWIPRQINEGHLDYFFWLLVGILILTLLIFLMYSSSYKTVQPKAQTIGNSPSLNLLPITILHSSHPIK